MRKKQPIAKCRKDAGLTIEEAALRFKVDKSTIIRWEKGEPLIPLKRLDDARVIFGVSNRDIRPDIFEAAQ